MQQNSPQYRLLYALLLESVGKAIGEMERMNYGRARELLVDAREYGLGVCGISSCHDAFLASALPPERE